MPAILKETYFDHMVKPLIKFTLLITLHTLLSFSLITTFNTTIFYWQIKKNSQIKEEKWTCTASYLQKIVTVVSITESCKSGFKKQSLPSHLLSGFSQ